MVIDQCRVGQKAADGKPIKKPTTLIASASELLEPFQNLRCLGRHTHATTWGHGPVLSKAQKWTWQFAERIVEGITRLRRRLRQTAYPAVASGPQDPPQNQPEDWIKCPACRGNMAETRREHTRIPNECKWPLVEPEPEWTCPGCARSPPRPRGHEDHTDRPGECRWASAGYRGRARQGKHPREARRQAAASSVDGVPGPQLNPATNPPPPGNPLHRVLRRLFPLLTLGRICHATVATTKNPEQVVQAEAVMDSRRRRLLPTRNPDQEEDPTDTKD